MAPRPTRRELLALSALGLVGGCTAQGRPPLLRPKSAAMPAPRPEPGVGESILVCGEPHPVGVPVLTWRDPGGYDAYSTALRFPERAPADPPEGLRYAPGRKRPDGSEIPSGAGISALRGVVDLFVVHFDACGTSRTCFEVLHDRRKISVHFMLDLDGTLYQTLDLADTAWHARQANARSVGVEIASIGAYPPGESGVLSEWYESDERGVRVRIPERYGDGGLRARGFVGRPARPARVRGRIQGRELEMYDLTPEQYLSLARLAAALTRLFPRLRPDAPRYARGPLRGKVRREVLSDEELAAFQGILGHWHVSQDKVDPGPAFDWEGFLWRVRAEREAPAA